MAKVMQDLEKRGLVRRAEGGGATVEAVATPPSGPVSPNFK
jgi:hypothetical protein